MRIVILTYESHQANLMSQRLLETFPNQVVGIISSQVLIPGKSTGQALWYLWRKTGLGFVALKGFEIILSRFAALYFRLTQKQSRIPSLTQMAQAAQVPLYGSKQVNDALTRQQLAAWQPDLIISVYLNQRIGKKMIDLPSQGVINIHPALLPRNRGLFPYFWVLAHGETETGVTVHWVDPSFDTGAILLQESLSVSDQDTVLSLAERSAELGADLLVKAVRLIEQGNAPHLAQDVAQATYFSWPTPAAVRQFRQRGRRYGSVREMWQIFTGE